MEPNDLVRRAIDARLRAIEEELRLIEGIVVEQHGDAIRVRARAMFQRWLDDPRLRFSGRMR